VHPRESRISGQSSIWQALCHNGQAKSRSRWPWRVGDRGQSWEVWSCSHTHVRMPLKCDIPSQRINPSKHRLWYSVKIWTGRAQSSSSIGEREASCRVAFGKHLRQRGPHFTDLEAASETADPNLQPQTVRQSGRGRAMAVPATLWQRPPSLTLTTNLSMLEPSTFFLVTRR